MENNEYLVKFFQIAKSIENVELFPQSSKLSGTEFRILREILLEEEKGKCIISSELARRLGVTRSAISQIVTKLEEKGIVRRVGSDTDRKIAYVKLSERSVALFEEQSREANEIIGRVVEIFGAERLDSLIADCEKLSKAFSVAFQERAEAKNN